MPGDNAITFTPLEYTYTISKSNPHWVSVVYEHQGDTGPVTYYAYLKAFDAPSNYGFLCGRISKLEISRSTQSENETLFGYDRGDFYGFLDEPGRLFLKTLVEKFN